MLKIELEMLPDDRNICIAEAYLMGRYGNLDNAGAFISKDKKGITVVISNTEEDEEAFLRKLQGERQIRDELYGLRWYTRK